MSAVQFSKELGELYAKADELRSEEERIAGHIWALRHDGYDFRVEDEDVLLTRSKEELQQKIDELEELRKAALDARCIAYNIAGAARAKELAQWEAHAGHGVDDSVGPAAADEGA